jgi:hypothetical protein
MNHTPTLSKIQFSVLLNFLCFTKTVPVPCSISPKPCCFRLDSLKQSCREFVKLQLCQLACLEIRAGLWVTGPGSYCYFYPMNVAAVSGLCFKVERFGNGIGEVADQQLASGATWRAVRRCGPTGRASALYALRSPPPPFLSLPHLSSSSAQAERHRSCAGHSSFVRPPFLDRARPIALPWAALARAPTR